MYINRLHEKTFKCTQNNNSHMFLSLQKEEELSPRRDSAATYQSPEESSLDWSIPTLPGVKV